MVDDPNSTVELPADPLVKELAHEVEKTGNNWAGPLLYDLFQYLSTLDTEDPNSQQQLRKSVDPKSDLSPGTWGILLDELGTQNIVNRELGGTDTYTLQNMD